MTSELKAVKLTGTTDASGDLTLTATHSIMGWLVAVEWVDGTLADGVDAVLSTTVTPSGVDQTLLTLTNANNDAWYFPRLAECDNTGTALGSYTLPVINGTLKLVISSGGNAATGGALVYYHSR